VGACKLVEICVSQGSKLSYGLCHALRGVMSHEKPDVRGEGQSLLTTTINHLATDWRGLSHAWINGSFVCLDIQGIPGAVVSARVGVVLSRSSIVSPMSRRDAALRCPSLELTAGLLRRWRGKDSRARLSWPSCECVPEANTANNRCCTDYRCEVGQSAAAFRSWGPAASGRFSASHDLNTSQPSFSHAVSFASS
jgi:hypothetical protein